MTSFTIPNNATAVSVVLLNRFLNRPWYIDYKAEKDARRVTVYVINSQKHVVPLEDNQPIMILAKCDELD
jgi:hypothetical protein